MSHGANKILKGTVVTHTKNMHVEREKEICLGEL